jgi:hypothetical protein
MDGNPAVPVIADEGCLQGSVVRLGFQLSSQSFTERRATPLRVCGQLPREIAGLRLARQHNTGAVRTCETGATRLEPHDSGVTGPFEIPMWFLVGCA